MQAHRKRTLPTYRKVAKIIEREIVEGHICPGQLLPPETELAKQFAVNRSTMREAIRLLEETGLLNRKARRRLAVAIPASDNIASQVTRALIMHEVTFHELWEVTMAVEPLAAQLAARNVVPAIAQALVGNLERTAQAMHDPEQLSALDVEFHALIADAAGNRALLMAREPLGRLFYPAFKCILESVDVAAPRLLAAHRKIFNSILGGDPARAREWMHRHIVDFRRGYMVAGLDLHQSLQDAIRESDTDTPGAFQMTRNLSPEAS